MPKRLATIDEIVARLDACIRYARKKREEGQARRDEQAYHMAVGAVDAFQAIRLAITGDTLPEET